MKKYNVKVNGTAYEIEIEQIGGTAVQRPTFSRPGVPTRPSAPARPAAPAAAPAAPVPAFSAPAPAAVPSSAGGETIKAPMPGNILDVLVAAGQSVTKGQVLLILEAMKMENEIMAPRDGVVSQLGAAKGNAVNSGDILCVIA